MNRRLLGSAHPELARSLTGLGQVLSDPALGSGARLVEAEELLGEALAIRRRELGEEHWQTAETASALGGCLAAQGRVAEAELLLRESHRRLAETLGSERRETRRAGDRLVAIEQALRGVEEGGQAAGGLAPHSE